MNNAIHHTPETSEEPNRLPASAGATPSPCPRGPAWCRYHESDECNSRTVTVAGAVLQVGDSEDDREPRLSGLNFLSSGLETDTARQVAAAIVSLLEEVGR